MTTAQLLFVALSAIAGGMVSAGAWRSVRPLFARKRRAPMRLSDAQTSGGGKRANTQTLPGGPPKPASAAMSVETEQVLRAISRLHSTMTDLAKVQLDLIRREEGKDTDVQVAREDFDRVERALKALPGILRKDLGTLDPQEDDRRTKRLEARLDKTVRAASAEQSDSLSPRLEALEARLDTLASQLGAQAGRAVSRDDLVDALTGATNALEKRISTTLLKTEERLEEVTQSIAADLAKRLARPDPQRDRIEALLEAIRTRGAGDLGPVQEAASAAISGYRATPGVARPEPAVLPTAEPVAEIADGADGHADMPAELTQSEQRLLRTHPGLASILLNKNTLRRGSG